MPSDEPEKLLGPEDFVVHGGGSARHRFNRRKLSVVRAGLKARGAVAGAMLRLVRERRATGCRLNRFGLEPLDVVEVTVDRLVHQRPVRCELISGCDATPLGFLDRYFTDESGKADWRISRSMHARLLQDHSKGRLPRDLTTTDYWRWHVQLHDAGINDRPAEMIDRKVRGLISIYESIEEQGYVYGGLNSYVWVLEQPLIQTRYNIAHYPDGLEIFDGHHRAAAAAVLGYETLHVLLLRDVGRATAFGVLLDDVQASRR